LSKLLEKYGVTFKAKVVGEGGETSKAKNKRL